MFILIYLLDYSLININSYFYKKKHIIMNVKNITKKQSVLVDYILINE